MTKLNFKIRPKKDFLYDQVTTQITPIQERQSSPANPRSGRNRTHSGASSSLASSAASVESAGPLYSEIEMPSHYNGSYWSKKHTHKKSSSTSLSNKQKKRRRGKRGDTTFATRDETSFPSDNDDDSSTSSTSLEQQRRQEGEREYSNNERLLLVAFVSFMSFSITQLYFAFRAESEAMKGDSAAMMVDSLTYLFNWIAERQKHVFDRNYQHPMNLILTPERAKQVRQRTKRKVTLQWEIIPPLVSVSTLLIVTGVVLRQASRVIWLDLHRDPNLQSDPNIDLMMGFALVNLALDGVNFCCFAQASHLFGYDTMEEDARVQLSSSPDGQHVALDVSESSDYSDDHQDFMREHAHRRHHHHHQHANLNMVSFILFVCLFVPEGKISGLVVFFERQQCLLRCLFAHVFGIHKTLNCRLAYCLVSLLLLFRATVLGLYSCICRHIAKRRGHFGRRLG